MNLDADHYDHFHQSSRSSWIHGLDYLDYWREQIVQLLALKPSDRFVDIGCGDGHLATHISQSIGFSQVPLGVEQNDVCLKYNKDYLDSVMLDAESFLENKDEAFDKLLLKQIIHHVYRPHRKEILGKMYRALKPGGRMLILSMPDKLCYPVFDRVLEVYEQNESDFNFEQLQEDLNAIGFTTHTQRCTYKVHFTKEKYLQAISERFISTLSMVTAEEMKQGLVELDKKLPDTVAVEDPLIALVAVKK